MSSRPWPSSRISRSSTQGQIGPFTRAMPVLPPENDAVALRVIKTPRFAAARSRSKAANTASFHGHRRRNCNFLGSDNKRQEATGQPRRNDNIFEINSEIENSMTTTKNEIDHSFGGFLRECASCHKKLEENKDKYMYGFLGAFCSPECRRDKIRIDGFYKKFPSESATKHIKIPRSKIIMPPRRINLGDDSDSSD